MAIYILVALTCTLFKRAAPNARKAPFPGLPVFYVILWSVQMRVSNPRVTWQWWILIREIYGKQEGKSITRKVSDRYIAMTEVVTRNYETCSRESTTQNANKKKYRTTPALISISWEVVVRVIIIAMTVLWRDSNRHHRSYKSPTRYWARTWWASSSQRYASMIDNPSDRRFLGFNNIPFVCPVSLRWDSVFTLGAKTCLLDSCLIYMWTITYISGYYVPNTHPAASCVGTRDAISAKESWSQ